jgi:hypothetical protein
VGWGAVPWWVYLRLLLGVGFYLMGLVVIELYRWNGDEEKAERQVGVNERFRRAVEAVETRWG